MAEVWDWQLDALCRGMTVTLFFHPWGERGESRAARDEAAKSICEACPVIAECRQHALTVAEPYGVWGGLTEEDRLVLLNKRTRHARKSGKRRAGSRKPAQERSATMVDDG